jgi:peptidylprolyl isomerase
MGARESDTVTIHYSVILEDGSVYETSRERAPLLVTLGAGELLPGLEKAVLGLEPGESTKVTVPPEEAYGPRIDGVTDQVPMELFGEAVPDIGAITTVIADDGSRIACRITALSDDMTTVTVDFNHPLAGETLQFEVELVEIVPVTPPSEGSATS